MAGRRITYLCCLLAVLVFYVAYQEWFSWIALLAVLGLPWLSLLVSLPGILTFRGEVTGPVSIPMGQSGRLRLAGTSSFPVPPFMGKIRLHRCLTGETRRQKKNEDIPADHCGGIRAVPEKVRVCDYLGLFRFRVRKVESHTVLVRPEKLSMAAPPDLNRYLTQSWKPKPGGGYAENHELRLYRPGDSLNQIHWKLTAKTGKLTIREAMEPNRGRVLLTMDIRGTAGELDRKFGQLQWLGEYLLENNIPFEIRALSSDGVQAFAVTSGADLRSAVDSLLCCGPVSGGSVLEGEYPASWHYHIGGASDET